VVATETRTDKLEAPHERPTKTVGAIVSATTRGESEGLGSASWRRWRARDVTEVEVDSVAFVVLGALGPGALRHDRCDQLEYAYDDGEKHQR
jgi:hypothetical protein